MMNKSDSGRVSVVRAAGLVAVAVAALALSACNTVSGVGKDLQEASDNVKEAIED